MKKMSISTLRNLSGPVLNKMLADGEEITITSGIGKKKVFVAILMPYEKYAQIGLQLQNYKRFVEAQ